MSSGSAESGDFTIGDQLGKGGFGLVYRGTFRGRDVAIKKVRINDPTPEKAAREYDVILKLDHPNVLKLLHVKKMNGFRFTWS